MLFHLCFRLHLIGQALDSRGISFDRVSLNNSSLKVFQYFSIVLLLYLCQLTLAIQLLGERYLISAFHLLSFADQGEISIDGKYAWLVCFFLLSIQFTFFLKLPSLLRFFV